MDAPMSDEAALPCADDLLSLVVRPLHRTCKAICMFLYNLINQNGHSAVPPQVLLLTRANVQSLCAYTLCVIVLRIVCATGHTSVPPQVLGQHAEPVCVIVLSTV
jgi:hypothetical protein